MDYKEFVNETIKKSTPESLTALKKALIGEYITFSAIDEKDITRDILAEKICDYFERVELKTGKNFDKQIDAYMDNLDDIIERKIAKTPQPKKNSEDPVIKPRSRKYYEKANDIKATRTISVEKLLDFTRIIMCLYMAYINNKGKVVSDFEYSKTCLDVKAIIDSMKTEKIGVRKKLKFDTEDLYCIDTCTFVITIIALQRIMEE